MKIAPEDYETHEEIIKSSDFTLRDAVEHAEELLTKSRYEWDKHLDDKYCASDLDALWIYAKVLKSKVKEAYGFVRD